MEEEFMQKEKTQTIVLIGPPDCGKTTLGKLAAQKLGIEFVDTDELVVEKFNERYPESNFFHIFRYFLAIEHEVLMELANRQKPMILSTGAETPLAPEKARLLKRIGYVILLRRNKTILKEEAANRKGAHWVWTKKDGEKEKTEDASGLLTDIYFGQMPQYERIADAVLDNDSGIENGAASLIEIINAIP
jgi:shikimate kinase